MDMHMQMQLPEPHYRGICRILLLVCAAIMVAFFITGFFPYYDFVEGDTVTLNAVTYWDFPEKKGDDFTRHLELQEVSYTVEDTETHSLMAFLGFPDNYTSLRGFKKAGYNSEAYRYKVLNVMDVGPFMLLELFALLMTILIIFKATMTKAFICLIWGVFGTSSMFINSMLRLGNTGIRPLMIVLVIAELVVSAACFALYFADSHRVSKYLREQSDVYK